MRAGSEIPTQAWPWIGVHILADRKAEKANKTKSQLAGGLAVPGGLFAASADLLGKDRRLVVLFGHLDPAVPEPSIAVESILLPETEKILKTQ